MADVTIGGITLEATLADTDKVEKETAGGVSKRTTGAAIKAAALSTAQAITDASTFSFVIDEDSFASDSATKVPTQQSTKAYITSAVGAGIAGLGALASLNSVGAAQIDADAVGSSELADNAVDTNAIQAAAVTLAKMANLAENTYIGRAAGAGTGAPTALTVTPLTDSPAGSGPPDADDGFYGQEDGSTVQWTPAQVLSGIGAQPLDTDLTAIAALTSAANKVPYSTGAGTWALADFTAAGRALVDDADAAAQRTTLGLGTMAVAATSDYLALAGGTVTGDTTFTSGTGKTVIESSATINRVACYLADGDTQPALAFGFGVLAGGVGGSTAPSWQATFGADTLTVASGDDIRMTTAGTNSTSVVVVGGTQTLTSKRMTWRVTATTGNAPTWAADTADQLENTAITAAVNLSTNYTAGTPVAGDKKIVCLTANGAYAITWPSAYEASSTIALPTTTTTGSVRTMYSFLWNPATSKFTITGVS